MTARFETEEVYDRFYTGRSRDCVWTIYENRYGTRAPKDLQGSGVNGVRVVSFQDGDGSLTINEACALLTDSAAQIDGVVCRVSARIEFGAGDAVGDWILQLELELDDGAAGTDYEVVGGQREVKLYDGGPLA